MESCEVRGVVEARADHDSRVIRREMLIERALVERARLAIDGDEERLEPHRLDVFSEVVCHVGCDALDPLRALEHVPERHGTLENLVQILDVADTFELGEREELSLE